MKAASSLIFATLIVAFLVAIGTLPSTRSAGAAPPLSTQSALPAVPNPLGGITLTTPPLSSNGPGGTLTTPELSSNGPGGTLTTPELSSNGPKS
jgi:hypothetical protein